MRQLTKDVNRLKDKDIISTLLYALYRLTNNDEYSTLTELIYTVDKDSFYKLCSTFGGTTIRIPTISEMKLLTTSLLIYQICYEQNVSAIEACDLAQVADIDRKEVLRALDMITRLVEDRHDL